MLLDDVQLHLVNSLDEMLAFKEWLGRRRENDAIAFDTETSGLDTIRDRVRLFQFGDDTAGWAFDRDDWLGVARWVFANWQGELIGHNAPFDTAMLGNSCGIQVPRHRVHDTMVQSRINESHMSMALKSQSARHVDPRAAGLQMNLQGTGFDWATVPIEFPEYWTYAALDTVLTYALDEYHRPIVQSEAPAAYDLEMAVLWVVERMRTYGTHCDVDYARTHLETLNRYCEDVERWCATEFGIKPGSNVKVIEVLESAGHKFTKSTQSGAKALDAEVLGHVDHPLAQAVLARRQAQKMASTYLRFYVENADANGLIHPSFNTLGARTSRMSCSDPNLQNLPRAGSTPFADLVRNCIVTRHGRWEVGLTPVQNALRHGALITCDFDQIEMRLLAHYAGDVGMAEAFRAEGDFFVNLARQIFQDESIDKKDRRRQITKNAGYAKIYSAGVNKFALTAGIPVPQARAFLQRFDQLYPGVRRFQDDVLELALERQQMEGIAYARSPFTNRRYVADRRKEYALINYLTQGGAAEINKMKLVQLDAAGLGEFMFATVHDEVLLDVPGDHVLDVVRTLEATMNDYEMLSIPLTASVSFGERWGSKMDWAEQWELAS